MSAQHRMSHDHSAHDHSAQVHSHGGSFVHEPAAAAQELYAKAYESAQPDAGRRVVPVELEASEVEWSIAPGATIQAWAFNGQVPGPVIEGQVGDVLEIRLTNRLPEPRGKTVVGVFVAQFKSPFIYLLLAAGAVSLGLGDITDAAFIFAVLLSNAAIGTYQEWRAETRARALKALISRTSAR